MFVLRQLLLFMFVVQCNFLYAQEGKLLNDQPIILNPGDTIVLSADTTVKCGYRKGGKTVTYKPETITDFTFNNVDYTITGWSTPGAINGNSEYFFNIIAVEKNGSRFFNAHVSVSIKPAGGGAIIYDKCRATYACSGQKSAGCMLIRKEGCSVSCSSKCKLSVSYDRESLAYAIEQHFIKHMSKR